MEVEELEKEINLIKQKNKNGFLKSINLLIRFYAPFFLILCSILFIIEVLLYFNEGVDYNLLRIIFYIISFSSVVILSSSLIIAIALWLNYSIEKNDKFDDFSFQDRTDCFIRCSAGLLEITLYAIFFAVGLGSIVIGYLVLKTLSVWKGYKKDEEERGNRYTFQKREGIHTGVLRIATVLSLSFSLMSSYFLFKFLQQFSTFKLTNHFLFK